MFCSNPLRGSSVRLERWLHTPDVVGSNPSPATNGIRMLHLIGMSKEKLEDVELAWTKLVDSLEEARNLIDRSTGLYGRHVKHGDGDWVMYQSLVTQGLRLGAKISKIKRQRSEVRRRLDRINGVKDENRSK